MLSLLSLMSQGSLDKPLDDLIKEGKRMKKPMKFHGRKPIYKQRFERRQFNQSNRTPHFKPRFQKNRKFMHPKVSVYI